MNTSWEDDSSSGDIMHSRTTSHADEQVQKQINELPIEEDVDRVADQDLRTGTRVKDLMVAVVHFKKWIPMVEHRLDESSSSVCIKFVHMFRSCNKAVGPAVGRPKLQH
jgi:hypothetical protein